MSAMRRREGEVAEAGAAGGIWRAQPVDVRRRVEHARPGRRRTGSVRMPGEVVADAHVEDGVVEAGREAGPARRPASISTSIAALTYSSSDCSSRSSCDHSTL